MSSTEPASARRTGTSKWIAQRAARTFRSGPVSADLIRCLLDGARWTGSARNTQPWRVVAVRDRLVLGQLSRLGRYAGPLAEAPVGLVLLSPETQWRDTAFDLGRFTQSLTTLAAEAGLGACPVSLHPEACAAKAAALVHAPVGWVARHAIAIGWPAPRPPGRLAIPAGRLEVDELLSWFSDEERGLPGDFSLPREHPIGSPTTPITG